ncbi:MAG: glycosyltransferase family 87 protein, partial [Chthoniobacterales bacterium]
MTALEETPQLRTNRVRARDDRAFRVVLWLFGLVLLVFAVVPVLQSVRGHSLKDYELWQQTGHLVLQGRGIYPDRFHKFDFMYPPSCALLLAPVSLLGQTGLVIVLVVVNAAAWVASIFFSVRLSTGTSRRAAVFVYAVPNAIVLIYVWGNFLLGQPTLLLLALMLGAFLALQRRGNVLAGSLIACAAAIKAFPVIAILYLLYRRYWIAAASLIISLAFLLVVLPIFARGSAQASTDLQRWVEGMLLKYDEKGLGQRAGKSNVWKNQSIFGVANRMLRHVDYDDQYAPH